MDKPNKNLEREIDLSILIKKASQSFVKALLTIFNFLLRCFSYLVLFGLKQYIILLLALLVGFGFGMVKHFMGEELYSSDMVLQSNEIPTEDMISKINELGIYAGEGNYKALSEKLKIDTLTAGFIKSIGAYWFVDMDRDGVADIVDYRNRFNAIEDTTSRRMRDLLDVRATVGDPSVFAMLQNGIVHFLKSDPRLTLMNNNRKTALEIKIKRIDNELAKLDSLQRYEYFDKEREMSLDLGNLGSLKLLGEEKDTRLLHNEIIELQDTRLAYERQLTVTGDMVSVVTDFPVSVKPIRSMSFEGVFYGLLLFIIVYALLFILGHRKVVLDFLEKNA